MRPDSKLLIFIRKSLKNITQIEKAYYICNLLSEKL